MAASTSAKTSVIEAPRRSLAQLHPLLAAQLDDARNDGVDVAALAPRSNERVWWRCPSGHVWRTSPDRRVAGTGCPYCSRSRPWTDNSLAVLRADLAAEWHPYRNDTLSPADVLPASGRRVWWQCHCGREWAAVIAARTAGTGCPTCADSTRRGEPLIRARPELVDQWDAVRNGPLDATTMAGSHRSVWWRCEQGHRWSARIQTRVRHRSACPYCSGRRPTTETSLAAVRPDVASEWHPDRNGDLAATDVLPGSRRRVWWRCRAGHEWDAVVSARARGTGCPFCSGRRVTRSASLAALRPDLAAELVGDDVDAATLAPQSNRRLWWRCRHGHRWAARISDRTRGHGCPTCSGRRGPMRTAEEPRSSTGLSRAAAAQGTTRQRKLGAGTKKSMTA